MACPIGSRCPASPLTRRCRDTMRSDSSGDRTRMVVITVSRLVITLPIAASRSAIAEVSDAVEESRLSIVPPSPWKTWMIS